MSANSPDRIQVEIDRLTMIKNTPPMFGIDDVKYVKEMGNTGNMGAKQALQMCRGDRDRAVRHLRGDKKAAEEF